MERKFEILAPDVGKTDEIAGIVAESFDKKGGLVCLYGDIGAGKTTFVKYFAKCLGIKEKVTSPSFVILNEYHSGRMSLYHFDLYRLETSGIDSVLDEIREYLYGEDSIAMVEWAEFSSGELPSERIEIKIIYVDEFSRSFEFKLFGDKLQETFDRIQKALKAG